MRTIYLKRVLSTDYPFGTETFYKVTETHSLEVDNGSIETKEHDDFFETVTLIKNICHGLGYEGAEEISKEEFDAFFIETVTKINQLSAA